MIDPDRLDRAVKRAFGTWYGEAPFAAKSHWEGRYENINRTVRTIGGHIAGRLAGRCVLTTEAARLIETVRYYYAAESS